MTQYVILLPGDEAAWQHAAADERAATYDRHRRFMDLLHERGHRVSGGAELTPSSQARVVRGDLDAVTVSEGPYAETVEQLSGFYLVESDDLDDLAAVCGILASSGSRSRSVPASKRPARDPAPGDAPRP